MKDSIAKIEECLKKINTRILGGERKKAISPDDYKVTVHEPAFS